MYKVCLNKSLSSKQKFKKKHEGHNYQFTNFKQIFGNILFGNYLKRDWTRVMSQRNRNHCKDLN